MNTTTLISELSVDKLLARAREDAGGLSNFGPDNYRESLRVLLEALEKEANLSPQGQQMLYDKLVSQLVNRLLMEDYCERHPEILQLPINDPLVIVGLPRTGTTMLQRTLAVDPRFYSAAWWETRFPAPLAGETLAEPKRRIEQACAEVAQMKQVIPQILAIHPLDAMLADEEFMLMEHSFMCAMDAYVNVPSYTRWLDEQDQRPVYAQLKKMLQFLQWQKAQRGVPVAQRWLLKAPQHLHTLELLFEVFPQAQIILTHRDPAQTIPSMASMAHTLWQMYSDQPDARVTGQQWNSRMARAIRHTMAVREDMPASRFLDVRFEDTVSNPLGVIEAVYQFAGLPLTPEARGAIQGWLANNGRENRASHDYSMARFGLSESQLDQDYAEYRKRHISGRVVV
jgi:hypothetical protein